MIVMHGKNMERRNYWRMNLTTANYGAGLSFAYDSRDKVDQSP